MQGSPQSADGVETMSGRKLEVVPATQPSSVEANDGATEPGFAPASSVAAPEPEKPLEIADPAKQSNKSELVPSCKPIEFGADVTKILSAISSARRRPLFALISSFIDEEVLHEVYKWRREIGQNAKADGIDVLVHSPGGNLTSCYLLARVLARATDSWDALIPTLAASGATLISLGSRKLVMPGIAQMGPVDPQVLSKRPGKFFSAERQSPLEAFQAVKYLRELALSTIDGGMAILWPRIGEWPRSERLKPQRSSRLNSFGRFWKESRLTIWCLRAR